jgi:CMP-N-acetylneuraminic acid synthetase
MRKTLACTSFQAQTLMACRNRLGQRPWMFEIEASEAWDIDEEIDFDMVEFLIKRRR